MKTKRLISLFLAISLIALLCFYSSVIAKATTGDYILCESLGTGAPPTTLNGYTLYPFLPDANAELDYEHYEPHLFEHYTIPTIFGNITSNKSFWATTNSYIMSEWSHNYVGRVYLSPSSSIILTLPQYVKCFIVYVEPNNGFFCYITAKLNDGTTFTQRIKSSDATGFGFTAYGNQYIESVELTVQDHGGGLVFSEMSLGSVDNTPFKIQKTYSKKDLTSEFLADLEASYPDYMVSICSKQNGSVVSLKDVGVYDADITFTNGNSSKTLTFPSALKIIKASQPTPSTPALSAEATSINVTPVTDCEYSINGTDWQDGNVFNGLKSSTQYTIYMRYKATDSLNPSQSTSVQVTTLAANYISPKTGDKSNPIYLIILMFASFCAIIIFIIKSNQFT